jgi:hypothetical protein
VSWLKLLIYYFNEFLINLGTSQRKSEIILNNIIIGVICDFIRCKELEIIEFEKYR